MAKPLREAGHEVIIPQHQSVGRGKVDSGNALEEDATAVAETIRRLLSDGKDVVLFMHSYGGIAGSDAIGMLAEDGSLSKGPGKVRRLVYLAAHIIDKYVTFFGSRGSIPNVETDKVLGTHHTDHSCIGNVLTLRRMA